MAKVIPEGWREMKAIGAAQRELETLASQQEHQASILEKISQFVTRYDKMIRLV